MSETYSFDAQLKKGEKYEKELDDYFGEWYYVYPVSFDAQRSGIDRVFKHKTTDVSISVEYKADERTVETGNIFVETVSVDTQNKKGWAYTSCSQMLFYYIPQEKTVLVISMLEIKNQLSGWIKRFKEKSVPNDGYNTKGILVPLQEFLKHCQKMVMRNEQ